MKCTDCKYCIEEDWGYSNYTVEGTEVDCLLKKNSLFPVDRFYGEEPTLLFAGECANFIVGPHPQIDVEREDGELWEYSDDPEIIGLLKKRVGSVCKFTRCGQPSH